MPNSIRIAPSTWILGGTALCAMVWVLVRAWFQSITVDEATTYILFVGRSPDLLWRGSSNNHLLNTLLMWIATNALGVSHFTVRVPALLGAAVYIASAVVLCRRISPSLAIQWPAFVCVVFNPLVGDFLVAARGYGLASGFLLAAVALGLGDNFRSSVRRCAVCSALIGLSFVSNFSYTFAGAAAMLILLWWNWRRGDARFLRLAAAGILPGLAVTAAIAGYTLLHWPSGELYFGAKSLAETFLSMKAPSLYEPFRAAKVVQPYLFPMAGVLVAGALLRVLIRRRSDLRLVLSLLAIPILALGLHWVCFAVFGLLLPKERTALYVVTFGTLFVGALATAAQGRVSRIATRAALFVFAGYYLLCLRYSFFYEWRWDADTRAAYALLRDYEQKHCVTRVGMLWLYSPSLNFYREADRSGTRLELDNGGDNPPEGREIYVVNPVFDREFIRSHRLRIVYTGEIGQLVVAIAPEVDAPGRVCPGGR